MDILIIGGLVVGAVVVIFIVILVARLAFRAMRPQVREQTTQPAAHPTVVTAETAQEIERSLAQGQKIVAIKVLREQTGLSLADAKMRIDSWPNGVSVAQRRFASYEALPTTAVPLPTVSGGELSSEVVSQIDHLVSTGEKLRAIKVYRESTGLSLKEAKDRIEAWTPGGNAH